MEITNKQFFSHYIFHPLSKGLSSSDKARALASSIALGIFTLGICHLVCAIKYRNRTFQKEKQPDRAIARVNQATLGRAEAPQPRQAQVINPVMRAAEAQPRQAQVINPVMRAVEALPPREVIN